jgi:hypothetical protein
MQKAHLKNALNVLSGPLECIIKEMKNAYNNNQDLQAIKINQDLVI